MNGIEATEDLFLTVALTLVIYASEVFMLLDKLYISLLSCVK